MLTRKNQPSNLDARATEILLLQRMSEGHSSSWQEFLNCYGDLIYSSAFYTLKRHLPGISEEEIQDCVQDLFVSLMNEQGKKLRSFQGKDGCPLSGWLRTVATNHALMRLRKIKPQVSLDDLPENTLDSLLNKGQFKSPPSAMELAEEKQWLERIEQQISRFPTREKLVFQYFYQHECSRDEIAEILGLSPNHIDQILFRIRDRLKTELVEKQ